MHLLFWLSLIPFATGWMGENHLAPAPVALYGIVIFLAAIAYYILTRVLVAAHGSDSALAIALGKDWKGKLSVAANAIAIPLAFANSWLAFAAYIAIAAMWLVPDSRIEKNLGI